MEQETSFEELLKKHRVVVERYINFRLPSTFDADDVIQETYYAAYIGFEKLRNKELFKPWILSIARNQCNLWFRKKYGNELIPIDAIPDIADTDATEDNTAYQILNLLPKESAELLKLTVQGYKQIDIAKRLNIPIGTVKSRLHYARKQFRSMCTPEQILMFEKGRKNMAKKDYTCGFPEAMPTLILKESSRPFFEVKCADEGFIIPIVGNKNSEGTYRFNKLSLVSTCYVPKAAMIHEVAGVKIRRDTYNIRAGKLYKNEKIWFSQLTDEYIRDLATIDCDGDEDDDFPTSIYTFLEEMQEELKYTDKAIGENMFFKMLLMTNTRNAEPQFLLYLPEGNLTYDYKVTKMQKVGKELHITIKKSTQTSNEDTMDGCLIGLRIQNNDESVSIKDVKTIHIDLED